MDDASELQPLVRDDTTEQSPTRPDEAASATLKRELTFWHGFALVFCPMIGFGMFVSPGLIAQRTPNLLVAFIIWIVSGLITLFSASCYCELACLYRKTGSGYTFILETFGELAGFLVAWVSILMLSPASAAVLITTMGDHIAKVFFHNEHTAGFIWTSKGIGYALFVIVIIVNSLSVKLTARVQFLFTAAQLLFIGLIVSLGVYQYSTERDFTNLKPGVTSNGTSIIFKASYASNLSNAVQNGLWAFGSWSSVVYLAEEMENIDRNIPLILYTVMPTSLLTYIILNLSYSSALTHVQMGSSKVVALNFTRHVAGRVFADSVMPIIIAVSCLGTLNNSIYVISRVLLVAAREEQLPTFMGLIHRHRKTPIPANVCFAFVALLWLLSSSNVENFSRYFNFINWTIHGTCFVALIVLRYTKPDIDRPYKVYLINPIMMTLASVVAVITPFVAAPIGTSLVLGVTLLGIPAFYLFCKGMLWNYDYLSRITRKLMDIFDLVPCEYIDEKPNTFHKQKQ